MATQVHELLLAGRCDLHRDGRRNRATAASILVAHEPAPPALKQTILLVEDESFVRDVAREVLCSAGYGVVEAANATQAIARFRKHAGKVQLLLTDVVLPDRRGDDLARDLEGAGRNLKVIFISGYPENVAAQARFRRPGWSYLAKPFTAMCLLGKIEKVLQGEAGP
jgi:CheY-like chemotaxis protein